MRNANRDSMADDKCITNSIGMKLVLIPAGEFLMGSPDSDKMARDLEKPQHRVLGLNLTAKPARYPVALAASCCGGPPSFDNPCRWGQPRHKTTQRSDRISLDHHTGDGRRNPS